MPPPCHPAGGLPSVERDAALGPVVVDTFAGPVQVEWDPDAAVTPLGPLAFFAEDLKLSGRFDAGSMPWWRTARWSTRARMRWRSAMGWARRFCRSWPDTGALRTSPRCPATRVNPPLLGMTRVVSEDAVRRGLDKIEAEAGARWLDLPPRRYGAAAADRAPGVSTSTRRSSRFTATRRVPWSATIR